MLVKRVAGFVLATVVTASAASACPACKDSIGSEETKQAQVAMPNGPDGSTGPTSGLPSGFNASIGVMLAAFAGVLGMVGVTLVKGMRR